MGESGAVRVRGRLETEQRHHVALLLPSLAGGGVARVVLNLAEALLRHGHRADLVLCRDEGAYRDQLPRGLRPVVLRRGIPLVARGLALAAQPQTWQQLALPVLLPLRGAPALAGLGDLVRYLRRERPDAMIAAGSSTRTSCSSRAARPATRRSRSRTTRSTASRARSRASRTTSSRRVCSR